MLPIALGEATKLAGRMLDATKDYEFTIRFGEETDTLDARRRVVATSDVRPTLAEVEAVLARFTGAIEQVPPAFSALKIGGKPAYERSRAGEQLEMTPRTVTVHALAIVVESKADEVDALRHRLQGHLHPQPRPGHRPALGHRRPCYLSTEDAGRTV